MRTVAADGAAACAAAITAAGIGVPRQRCAWRSAWKAGRARSSASARAWKSFQKPGSRAAKWRSSSSMSTSSRSASARSELHIRCAIACSVMSIGDSTCSAVPGSGRACASSRCASGFARAIDITMLWCRSTSMRRSSCRSGGSSCDQIR